jgi:DNA-binding NarL/FixJ family response regulator
MISLTNSRSDAWSKVLSPREHDIALLVARGLSNKEVARELGLREGTVKINLHRIFQKLGTNNRYSLIVQARWAGDSGAIPIQRRVPDAITDR